VTVPEPKKSAHKRLVEATCFMLRVVRNGRSVDSEDCERLARVFVERLDAYLEEREKGGTR
jgi:hypothetical protein